MFSHLMLCFTWPGEKHTTWAHVCHSVTPGIAVAIKGYMLKTWVATFDPNHHTEMTIKKCWGRSYIMRLPEHKTAAFSMKNLTRCFMRGPQTNLAGSVTVLWGKWSGSAVMDRRCWYHLIDWAWLQLWTWLIMSLLRALRTEGFNYSLTIG